MAVKLFSGFFEDKKEQQRQRIAEKTIEAKRLHNKLKDEIGRLSETQQLIIKQVGK